MFGSAASGGVRAKRATVVAALIVAALAAGVAALVLAGPAWAATLTVDTASDEQSTNEECSLREAIVNANGNDQSGSPDCLAGGGEDKIGFAPSLSGQTIALASQLPTVTDAAGLTVDGPVSGVTVSGADQVRVFEVAEGAKLALDGLTVAGGNSAFGLGGGVLNRGALAVRASTLSGNSAPGGAGGGVANFGTAAVSGSTLSANSATNSVSGGGAGGGIYNSGTLTVSNSTLSGNGTTSGGGIYNSVGDTKLKNTIVANSPSGGDCLIGGGTITDGGYNLSSDGTCNLATANRSQPNRPRSRRARRQRRPRANPRPPLGQPGRGQGQILWGERRSARAAAPH